MITRITRILILLQMAIAIGLMTLAMHILHVDNAWIALTAGIIAVVLLRLAITVNSFFLAWRSRSETPAAFTLNRHQACILFKNEFKATMLTSFWSMPFYAFDKRPAQYPAGLPVLLIHGYGCNSGYWKRMSKALSQENITHHAIDMEPVFGSIDEYIDGIHHAVETLCNDTNSDKIIIVAHSMGGVAARAYFRAHGDKRIARLITLGTPHHGTALANFGIGLNGQQMCRSGVEKSEPSDWLKNLAESEDEHIRSLIVSIYSHHDNIVSPQTSSCLQGAKNLEFQGIGHVALALNPMIQNRVIEEIHLTSSLSKP